MEVSLWWLMVLVLVYFAVSVVMYFIQDYFLFHPEKLHSGFVFKYDIPFEEIILEGAENSSIDALLFEVEKAEKVVFYFKGNTRSIKGWAKFAKDFTSKGVSFFMIDYPGFGKSTGKRNEALIYKNAQIAYNWLKDKFGEENIIIYGRSLGSGFAACIAARNHPSTLILDSPYYNLTELARYYTRVFKMSWILKYRIPLCDFVKHTECPVYIIHGDKDRIIPYKFSPMIVGLQPERIQLFTVHGAGHNNLPKFQEYHTFLRSILDSKA